MSSQLDHRITLHTIPHNGDRWDLSRWRKCFWWLTDWLVITGIQCSYIYSWKIRCLIKSYIFWKVLFWCLLWLCLINLPNNLYLKTRTCNTRHWDLFMMTHFYCGYTTRVVTSASVHTVNLACAIFTVILWQNVGNAIQCNRN